ncbi:MAG TPA: hypothetical protein VLD65_04305 [Anaerolineales bacterium]|nr:hypothetical protein [Anaerolineales bacterium]
MAAKISRLNRLLMILMVVLYVITLGSFSYANWKIEPVHELWSFVLSGLILSIPLILFYGSIYVLVSAWYEHRLTREISPRLVKIIHWAPRIAAILIIFFVTLFSLDVFEMEASPLELLGAFIMHSLPSIVMLLLLYFAWRRPMVGFIAFLLAGLFFLRFVIFGRDLGHFLLFSGPLLLISALFYADWRWLKSQSPPRLKTAV